MIDRSPLNTGNAEFLDLLYRSWLADPSSVDPRWRDWFSAIEAQPAAGPEMPASRGGRSDLTAKQAKVSALLSANRSRGPRVATSAPPELYPLPLH